MVFITGATGFLGSYLTRLLIAKGEMVRALKRPTSDFSLLGENASAVEWVEGDLLDVASLEVAMKGVKKVYHCAGHISLVPAEYDLMMQVNIQGTANVMDVALNTAVEKLIHVSSIAAFGVAPEGKTIDESYSDPNIAGCFSYFRSKHYGEREAWRADAEGLKVIIACPSTILGGGWWTEVPNTLFGDVHRGLGFYVSSTNGFVDVRDTAECLYRLMESDISGEKFIISSENLSFRDVIWTIADEMGKKRPGIEAGQVFLSAAWRFEMLKSFLTGNPPVVTHEGARIAKVSFAYNNEKIKSALGYQFRPMKQTIAEASRAYLESVAAKKKFAVLI